MIVTLLQDAAGMSTLARLADPWARLYSDSKAVSAAVLFLHLVPLLVAGGTALVTDRGTLRAANGNAAERTGQLAALAATHPVILGGLTLSLVSGGAMFLSDVDTFLVSPFFWVKLGCIALLLGNGFVMTRTEQALRTVEDDRKLWRRLRSVAALSIVLWIATTLAGVVLSQYA